MDPRTKHPGVFCLWQGIMIETDIKKLKEAEWIRQHTLTKEQTNQLILNKLKRAEDMHRALTKREMPNHRHR